MAGNGQWTSDQPAAKKRRLDMASSVASAFTSPDWDERKKYLYQGSELEKRFNGAQRTLAADWTAITIEEFKKVNKIGEGTYGSVFSATAPSGNLTAVKMVRMESEKEGFPITAIREIKILRALDHPNIVRLCDVVTNKNCSSDRSKAQIFMVFEYVNHDLAGLMQNPKVVFKESHIKHLLKQILKALFYCHKKCNVLHRDMKGSNILVADDGTIKIADFGLARQYKDDPAHRNYTNRVVTLWYRAPELLFGDKKYGPAIDMWSAGCVFGEMLFGKPLFSEDSEMKQIAAICRSCGTPTEETWPGWTHGKPFGKMEVYSRKLRSKFANLDQTAFDLLDRLLIMNPDKRISAEEALDHDYFKTLPLAEPLDLEKILSGEACHEFEARNRRKAAKLAQQKQKQKTSSSEIKSESKAAGVSQQALQRSRSQTKQVTTIAPRGQRYGARGQHVIPASAQRDPRARPPPQR